MAENENIIQQVYLTDEGKLYDLYAKNLIDVEPTTDTAPYLFRQSGGDNNAYVGTEETDKLVGASAVVNQLVNPNGTTAKTASGSVVSISDAIASPVIDLKTSIVATQDLHGQSAPYPSGGQLWDEEGVNAKVDISTTTGELIPAADYYFRVINYIPIMPNTTYYDKNDAVVGNYRIFYYDNDKNYLSYISHPTKTAFTTPSNAYYMLFRFLTRNSEYEYENNISINYPATDTSYHPYSNICPISGFSAVGLSVNGVVTSIQLGDTVYSGSLNVTTGVLTVNRGYVLLDGSDDEEWSFSGTRFIAPINGMLSQSARTKVECNCGVFSPTATTDGTVFGYNGSLYYYLSTETTLSEFKTWLSNNNMQVVYPLKEPFEVQLTPTEVSLVLGNNTVFADTGDVTMTYDAPISSVPTISGHKYYTRINSVVSIQNGTGTAISINDATEDNVSDLTAMFGTAIADYIYSLEQATAGSGIAYLRKYGFFAKDYIPYTANALQSVNTSKHTMVGLNQWDEVWENGTFNTTTGANINNSTVNKQIRSKNYIPVVGDTLYYINQMAWFIFFDENKNVITEDLPSGSSSGNSRAFNNATFKMPKTCSYVRFYMLATYGDTYNNDVCLNISSSKDGTYEPYIKHEYALPNVDLRGLYKLDASNNLYADGDTLEGDGTLTRKYGVIDLGTLTWSAISGRFRAPQSQLGTKKGTQYQYTAYNLINSKYPVMGYGYTDQYDKVCDVDSVGNFRVKDSAYTDVQTFKAAMSGVYLIYELETPTTESTTGFTNPQIVDKYGTEEYTDERDFPLPVGHETDYLPTGDKAKLNSLPDATVQNGDFIIRQNNTKMTLQPYESDIDDTVISSTKTYSSEKIQSLLLLDGSSIGF